MATLLLRGQLPNGSEAPASGWAMRGKTRNETKHGNSAVMHASSADEESPADTLDVAPRLYNLRLCNGYAAEGDGLEMRRLEEPRLVEYPLAYKECKDFRLPLKAGDKLQFKTAGQVYVGTFEVSSLPVGGSVLLLVPHREAPGHILASFVSHVFEPSESPQIALVDAYAVVDDVHHLARHPTPTYVAPTMHIVHRNSVHEGIAGALAPGEDVSFNSVVALTPGRYWLSLNGASDDAASLESSVSPESVDGEGGLQTALREARSGSDSESNESLALDAASSLGSAVQLSAQTEETYVAVRVGDSSMLDYPEEILVFPQLSAGRKCFPGVGFVGGLILLWRVLATQ